MDWIYLAQDRDRWQALVNAVMNSRLHKMRGISWLAENLLPYQEIRCQWNWLVTVVGTFYSI